MNKRINLHRLLVSKVGENCTMRYNPRIGWMISIERRSEQLIGYNYVQAFDFICRFDWDLLMKTKKEVKDD